MSVSTLLAGADAQRLYERIRFTCDIEAWKTLLDFADQGCPVAQSFVGIIYFRGSDLTGPIDKKKSSDYISKCATFMAETTDMNVRCLYACMLRHGLVVPMDKEKATEIFLVQSSAGHPQSQADLGFCYINGHGVPKNGNLALEWSLKAAESGNVDGQNNVGYCYLNWKTLGINTVNGQRLTSEEAMSEGFKWSKIAAENGSTDGQNNVGYCYSSGVGVALNHALAAVWFQKAADRGHFVGQRNIATAYLMGNGAKKSYVLAMKYFRLCEAQHDEAAPARIIQLQGLMAALWRRRRVLVQCHANFLKNGSSGRNLAVSQVMSNRDLVRYICLHI
jgi:TPR repeat protein